MTAPQTAGQWGQLVVLVILGALQLVGFLVFARWLGRLLLALLRLADTGEGLYARPGLCAGCGRTGWDRTLHCTCPANPTQRQERQGRRHWGH